MGIEVDQYRESIGKYYNETGESILYLEQIKFNYMCVPS
jgi:hypothetical protein